MVVSAIHIAAVVVRLAIGALVVIVIALIATTVFVIAGAAEQATCERPDDGTDASAFESATTLIADDGTCACTDSAANHSGALCVRSIRITGNGATQSENTTEKSQ